MVVVLIVVLLVVVAEVVVVVSRDCGDSGSCGGSWGRRGSSEN